METFTEGDGLDGTEGADDADMAAFHNDRHAGKDGKGGDEKDGERSEYFGEIGRHLVHGAGKLGGERRACNRK
jgi:hypothetical protein